MRLNLCVFSEIYASETRDVQVDGSQVRARIFV